MNGIDKLADVLVNSIKRPDNKPKPKPYDTPAEVRRVEGDTAFVHIPGGVDETPVKLTINAKAGDSVQVRISGGRAFLVGNASSPPTDDSTAIYVQKQVLELNNSFIENSNIVNAEIVNLKAKDSELDQAIVIQSNIVKSEIYNSQIEDFTVINGVVQGLKATDAEISGKITAAEADIGNLKANKADISELEANYAHITNGVIDNAKIGYADVNDLNANYAHISNGVIDNAKIGYADVNDLNAHYANIDLANVNNAWIQNGVIKDAAITDAQIIGVGANKITAGVIDASKITVTNLNADNITAGTINGQRIGTGSLSLDKLAEEVPTKEYLDDLADNLQGQIDGQIETWTGTTVPTLNNAPAVDWKGDAKKLKAHVGDIYYVVNAANDADGYTYRFTESGSGLSTTYSWTLIKDNQITKALQEIQEAKGDITGIKQFDSEISSWKTDTDEELSSLKGRTTTLETDIGTKVSTQTFNELSQTVDENTASISSLSETVDTKADGSTVQTLSNTVNTVKQTADTNKSNITNLTKKIDDNETDIEQKYSDLTQDLSGFKTTVGSTYHKISDFNTYKTANDAAVAAAKKAGDDAQADLDDYKDTVEETYATKSALTQTENSIKSEVSSTYATKASVPTKVSQLTNDKSYATTGQVDTAKSEATAAANSATDNKLKSYSTTTQMNSAINQKADAITVSVAETYSTKSDTDTKISKAKAEIKVTTDGISTEVAKKTDKASIISTIRQSAESVKIKASQVEIDGATTFNAIKDKTDAAYDAKGAADAVRDNMLADTDAPSLTKVYGGSNRYWSDTANTSVTPSIVTLSDPPEPNLKYTARFVCDGTNETDDKGQRALTFYSAANTTDIPLKLGMKYTASWWGRATSGTGTMKTFLWFRATSDSGNLAGNHKFDLTSKWKLYTVTFELGTETSYNRLWFYAYFGAKTSGTIELCGFKLVPGENASTTGNAGGTNLLRNSQTMPIQATGTPGWRVSGSGVISKPSPAITNPPRPEFKGAIRVTNTSSSTSVIGIAQDYVDGKFIAGETYTMSFWARASEAATRVLACQPIWISDTNTTGTSNGSLGYGVSWDVSTEWRYYKFEGAVLGGSQQSRYSAGYVYRVNSPANGWIEVCGMKLERGNKATDWTPAPEDVQAEIDAVSDAVNDKADKTAAVSEEHYIYISKASGTTSVSGTTTWVTETGDKQNTWTTKRPTYNTSYPVLFVAKQKKVVSGTVTCTTPVKDDTTTVIDGGHITTGTIDSNRLNADTIKVNAANIQGNITIGKVDGLSTALAGKQPTGDYATNTALNNEVNARKASYATSSTDAGTQAKVASCSNFALYTGATVTVGFTKANTHATPTLNVNSTGAKTIRNYTGAALTAAEYKWVAGAALTFVYDGTYWRMQDSGATESKAAAAASASTASSKATAAATSASNASSSASTASTKASEAATSASTASKKASEASTSASTASSKATAAANSATTASTKASEASTSASTASSKATAAANSATTAENAKNVALDTITVKDTRNDNQPPSWYISNYPKKRVQEFKYTTKIGLSGDKHCWLQTDVPWNDSSGGYPKQTTEVNGKFYTRQGTAASTWSAWKDLAGIAENYIYAGSDGIKIANADPEHADTYQKQTADSTEFYVDGVKRSDISGNGLRVYDNDGVESASFGRVPIIGKSEKNHLQLDDDSVDFMDGSTLIGYVGSDSARFPVMHVQSRLSIGDKYELRVTPSGSLGLYLM